MWEQKRDLDDYQTLKWLYLKALYQFGGGEGGIRIYSHCKIPNDLNESGTREAIESTESLDGRT
jgi:hypothetical protein